MQYKFRGKDKVTGEWRYGYLFQMWDKSYMLWGTTNGVPCMYEVIPSTVGMWTGLLDKNKVEIYLGDLIKAKTDDSPTYNNKLDIWAVVFQDGEFCVHNEDDTVGLHYWQAIQIEVIGDIHATEEKE